MTKFDLKVIPTTNEVVIIGESLFGEAIIQVKEDFFSEMIDDSQNLRRMYDISVRNHELSFKKRLKKNRNILALSFSMEFSKIVY